MKKVSIALMVLGVLVAGLGIAWPYQSDSSQDCERFRAKAVALLEEATQAAGTPREQELMTEAEGESSFADGACERADGFRRQGYMILGGGVLLLVVGFVLSRKKAAA
jgi:hypothetical protein